MLGAVLPDLAPMAGIRLRRAGIGGRLGEGIACHVRADAAFHALVEFRRGSGALRRDLAARGLGTGPARAVGHAGWSCCSTGPWWAARPRTRSTAPWPPATGWAPHWTRPTGPGGTPSWPGAGAAAALRYDDPAWVADRLHAMLGRRPRLALAADVPTVADVLAVHVPAVAAVAGAVVAATAAAATGGWQHPRGGPGDGGRCWSRGRPVASADMSSRLLSLVGAIAGGRAGGHRPAGRLRPSRCRRTPTVRRARRSCGPPPRWPSRGPPAAGDHLRAPARPLAVLAVAAAAALAALRSRPAPLVPVPVPATGRIGASPAPPPRPAAPRPLTGADRPPPRAPSRGAPGLNVPATAHPGATRRLP